MSDSFEVSPAELPGLLAVLNHPEHQAKIGERSATILRIEQRAQRVVRITASLSGDDPLDAWDVPNPTVRIAIPEPPEEFASVPGAPQTTSRVYTLAEVDVNSRIVQIDLVQHGGSSPVMRWLSTLEVGDSVRVVGPRPHRIPGEGEPRVLLADSSALPAAARIVRRMPTSADSLLIAAVPRDEFALLRRDIGATRGATILRRVEPEGDFPLADAFDQLELPATVSVWAAGEREDVRRIRHRCKHELGLPAERMQVFGYWKRGVTNTRLDVERLRATQRLLATGGTFADIDDFEIEL